MPADDHERAVETLKLAIAFDMSTFKQIEQSQILTAMMG